MIRLRIIVVIHDLKRQGLSISAIARKTVPLRITPLVPVAHRPLPRAGPSHGL